MVRASRQRLLGIDLHLSFVSSVLEKHALPHSAPAAKVLVTDMRHGEDEGKSMLAFQVKYYIFVGFFKTLWLIHIYPPQVITRLLVSAFQAYGAVSHPAIIKLKTTHVVRLYP